MKNRSFTILSLASLVTFAALVASASAAPKTFKVSVTGHGRPLILIPGLACPSGVWDNTIAHYSGTFECHAISVAGFGDVPATDLGSAPLLETVREELASYIQEHHLAKPVLLGHSLGGFVALDLAAHHPEIPGDLVIVDSLPFLFGAIQPNADAATARKAAASSGAAFEHIDRETYSKMVHTGPNGSTMASKEEDLQRIINWGVASDGLTVKKAMVELYSTDLRPEISKITCPTLVFGTWLGYAPYSSHEHAQQVYSDQYKSVAHARIEITDTARHFVMLDDPKWLFHEMDSFLQSPDQVALKK
jgi:pimeloyl-ACP methyl ester carboxylesterase